MNVMTGAKNDITGLNQPAVRAVVFDIASLREDTEVMITMAMGFNTFSTFIARQAELKPRPVRRLYGFPKVLSLPQINHASKL